IGDEVHGVPDPHWIRVVAILPGELLDGIVAEIDDPDGMRAAAAIVAPLAGFVPAGDERGRDLVVRIALAVGRRHAVECARYRNELLEAACGGNGPELQVRPLRCAGTV